MGYTETEREIALHFRSGMTEGVIPGTGVTLTAQRFRSEADSSSADGSSADGSTAVGSPADSSPADGSPADCSSAGGSPAGGSTADGSPAASSSPDGSSAEGREVPGLFRSLFRSNELEESNREFSYYIISPAGRKPESSQAGIIGRHDQQSRTT
ncbi:MAG: hypothetical protein MUE37_08590 [Bacteroidales bacterium]|nr:hypothetical protein [Bacteroidales bacterium]